MEKSELKKNWMIEIPKTDKEIKKCINETYDPFIANNLNGLYRIYRAQGATVMASWEKVLKRHLDIKEVKH